MADDAEARQHHDVDLGMAEEPKQVLKQHWIPTAFGARGHQREKNHDQAMASHEHVIGVRIGENLQTRLLQFHPDHD
jgi:hypothetical protein